MSLPFDYCRCTNEECPVKDMCHRSPENNPHDSKAYRITISEFKPTDDGCEHLIPMGIPIEKIQQKLRDVHGSD